MPRDRHELRLAQPLGTALAELMRKRWPSNTAKEAQRAWGIEPETAANAIKGHASPRTISKAIAKEGRALWNALGDLVCDQTQDEFEEALIQQMTLELERANERKAWRDQRRSQLLAASRQLGAVVVGLDVGADRKRRG